jgi:hypothetical protein
MSHFAVFTMDGIEYDVNVMKLSRNAKVTDTDNSGRTLDGAMHRDIIGTFYNYTLEIAAKENKQQDYDRLYDAASAPVDSHDVVFPYGQETLSFKAYVTETSDTMIRRNGVNLWGRDDNLKLNFIAMKPQRRR